MDEIQLKLLRSGDWIRSSEGERYVVVTDNPPMIAVRCIDVSNPSEWVVIREGNSYPVNAHSIKRLFVGDVVENIGSGKRYTIAFSGGGLEGEFPNVVRAVRYESLHCLAHWDVISRVNDV